MTAGLSYIYSSLTNILPKQIAENLIFVLTNCNDEDDINFKFKSANECFGFT